VTSARVLREGDEVTIRIRGVSAKGRVELASPNGRSLIVTFEGILGGYAGGIPVLREEDGAYRSVVDNELVELVVPVDWS
jgi:hypothetical protein